MYKLYTVYNFNFTLNKLINFLYLVAIALINLSTETIVFEGFSSVKLHFVQSNMSVTCKVGTKQA